MENKKIPTLIMDKVENGFSIKVKEHVIKKGFDRDTETIKFKEFVFTDYKAMFNFMENYFGKLNSNSNNDEIELPIGVHSRFA